MPRKPKVSIRLGDCLDVLAKIPSGSIAHVVSDPPYGQSNEAYDSSIACRPEVWRECFRVAGPNAALVAFAGSPTYHRIAAAIEAGGWRVRQMWAWLYRDGMISSAWPREGFDRLGPSFDPIVFATKGKVLLRLEREGDEAWRRAPRSGRAFSDRSSNATAAVGRWPKSLASDGSAGFEYFALRRARSDLPRTGHPNQKPLALLRWIVSKLPAGGAVLDPFCGSGTTLEAARLEGFDSIGIERDPAFLAMARDRLLPAAPVAIV